LLEKIVLFIDAESEQTWIVKSETFNLGLKIGFLLCLTCKNYVIAVPCALHDFSNGKQIQN